MHLFYFLVTALKTKLKRLMAVLEVEIYLFIFNIYFHKIFRSFCVQLILRYIMDLFFM